MLQISDTLIKSTNPVPALRAAVRSGFLDEATPLFAAFMIQRKGIAELSKYPASSACSWTGMGNSCISERNLDASPLATAKANAVSWEIGCSGLPVVGRSWPDAFSFEVT